MALMALKTIFTVSLWKSILALALLLQYSSTRVQAYPTARSDAHNDPNPAMEAIRATYHLPGLAAARASLNCTTKGQPHVASRAVGVRKQGNDTRLTTHDQFHLGSLTKAMTATLLAMLIEDPGNKLTWETTLPAALPDIAGNMSAVHRDTTLAMLGSHYSGINDTLILTEGLDIWLNLRNYTPVEGRNQVIQFVLSRPTTSTPGTAWLYSNVNYMIIGHLIDTHTKASGGWETFIQQRLWRPLGMTTCGFGTPPERTLQSIDNPWPHLPGNQSSPDPIPVTPDALSDNPPALGPAGTVHCGIEAYSRFLALHLKALLGQDTPLLPRAAFARLHTPYLGGPGNGTAAVSYTPGAWVVSAPVDIVGGRYLFHDGSNELNYAYGLLAPGRREAYFSATNVGSDRGELGANEVLLGFFNNTLGF